MNLFSRIVIGYHGCTESFARDLLLGTKALSAWQPSTNDWDWLGHGIYFWEHSPTRALRWAEEKWRGTNETPAILGAHIQLGECFDLLDEAFTDVLAQSYLELEQDLQHQSIPLPQNRGSGLKRRDLDCLVINDCLERLGKRGLDYSTVRGAFLEGTPVYPGAGFSRESHIQVAVRDLTCILGVFRPQ